ncbi:MAG: metal-dependent hydrolase [Ketobacteraceae bacterium]|nr:metal-dependent hydrolase [Ketobacteraceae bacterium]
MHHPGPVDLDIIAREVELDVLAIMRRNRYWLDNDPVKTHFFNGIQTAFPETELFFIDSVRDGVSFVGEDSLTAQERKNIREFIKQEALHGREHRSVNSALISLGYDEIAKVNDRVKKGRIAARTKYSLLFRLGLTAAAEHITAVLADYTLLRKPELINACEIDLKELLIYHSIEEIEHKSIAFDLYMRCGGGYWGRFLTFWLAVADAALITRYLHKYLLRSDGLWNARTRWRAFSFVWGSKGIAWAMLPKLLNYIRPGFHPWDTDEREVINQQYRLSKLKKSETESSSPELMNAS